MENIISAIGYIMVIIFMGIFLIVTLYLSTMIIVYITSDLIELWKYIRKYIPWKYIPWKYIRKYLYKIINYGNTNN